MVTKKKDVTNEALGEIFGNRETQDSLKEFADIDLERVLHIHKKGSKYYIVCLKREKEIVATPEEIVRQLWLHKLSKMYGYPMERIEVEHPVWFGQSEKKRADIVVFYRNKDDVWIVGEVKKPNRKDGLNQLKSYLNAKGAPIGFWSNGQSHLYLFRPFPQESLSLMDLPKEWESVDDLLGRKMTIDDLVGQVTGNKLLSLKDVLVDLEDLVLARRGVDVFEEAFRLIFAKLYDEWAARNKRDDRGIEFRVKPGEHNDDLHKRITQLFHEAIEKWPGVFGRDEREIKITGTALWTTISHLQNTLLFGSDLSVVDEAFEYLINKVYRGEKGQYFTPRHVIRMCIAMLDPLPSEKILDPAAGSGGFLVLSMFYVWAKMQSEGEKIKYASDNLYGIDFDEKAQKVAKAVMVIAGDGSSNIYRLNSLEPWTWKGEIGFEAMQKMLRRYEDDRHNAENVENMRDFKFDIILTNPPFAGDINEREVLRYYDVAKKDGRPVNKIGRHILFIERCLHFLKPGGRMAIVLPQGVLNGLQLEYIREYLFEKARVLAVVGLHGNTFRPHAGVKTSVVFLQKWGGDMGESQKDYPIFMAVSKRGGKDNSGDYIYKKGPNGEYVHDTKGRKVLDHDLDEIADGFLKFGKEQSVKR